MALTTVGDKVHELQQALLQRRAQIDDAARREAHEQAHLAVEQKRAEQQRLAEQERQQQLQAQKEAAREVLFFCFACAAQPLLIVCACIM